MHESRKRKIAGKKEGKEEGALFIELQLREGTQDSNSEKLVDTTFTTTTTTTTVMSGGSGRKQRGAGPLGAGVDGQGGAGGADGGLGQDQVQEADAREEVQGMAGVGDGPEQVLAFSQAQAAEQLQLSQSQAISMAAKSMESMRESNDKVMELMQNQIKMLMEERGTNGGMKQVKNVGVVSRKRSRRVGDDEGEGSDTDGGSDDDGYGSSGGEEEESDEDGPRRKKRKGAAKDSSTTTGAGKMLTRIELRRLRDKMEAKGTALSGKMSAIGAIRSLNRQAEARRMVYQVRVRVAALVKRLRRRDAAMLKTDATMWAKDTTAMVSNIDALIEYERNVNMNVDIGTRVKQMEDAVAAAWATAVGNETAMAEKSTLAAVGGYSGYAQGGGAAGGYGDAKNRYGRKDKEQQQDVKSAVSEAMQEMAAKFFPQSAPAAAPAAQQRQVAAVGAIAAAGNYGPRCWRCNVVGHVSRDCPNAAAVGAAGGQGQPAKANVSTSTSTCTHNITTQPTEAQNATECMREGDSRGGVVLAGDGDVNGAAILLHNDSNTNQYEYQTQTTLQQQQTCTTCKCGWCGECRLGIDIMEKERTKEISNTAKTRANNTRDKIKNKILYNEVYEAIMDNDTHTKEIFQNIYAKLDSEENEEEEGEEMTSWEIMGGGEEGEGIDTSTERDAPEGAQIPISKVLKGKIKCGKKAFDKNEEGRACRFCKKKGHRINTCMVRPPREEMQVDATTTGLQMAKQRFVLRLMNTARKLKVKEEMDIQEKKAWVDTIMREGEEANKDNPWAKSEKRRDKLRRQLGYWWAIGADKTVLGWIGFGVRLRFEQEPERMKFGNHKSYEEEKQHIEKEHEKHVKDGSFRVVNADKVKIGNPIQVEVNEKGKRRMCVDMRYSNAWLADYEFTQETINKHVANIVGRGMQMITTDVEKAYYQVPLHKESQGYCGWKHDGKWIVPTIIVFGLSVAPFVFTKIMRVVLKFMRMLGVRGTNCIDDNLWAAEPGEIAIVKEMVQLVFGRLGWVFNEKCALTPSTAVIYNGMWIDTEKYEIRATDEKIEAARKLAWKMWLEAADGKKLLLRDLQRLAGRLQSMRLALEGVAVWTRGMYEQIKKILRECGQRPHKWTRDYAEEGALEDIYFWCMRLGKQNGLPIRDEGEEIHVVINTDASDVGYGATVQREGNNVCVKIAGELPDSVLGESSTARELKGLMMALEEMKGDIKDKTVRVKMDSYPAVRNLVKGGGPVQVLNNQIREMWVWMKKNKTRIIYEWVPREENGEADTLSKEAAAEYKLEAETEDRIRMWLVERGLAGVSTCIWKRTKIRFPVLDKIDVRIREMRRSRVPGCIVVPVWPSQGWWPYLREHSVDRIDIGTMEEVVGKGEQCNYVHKSNTRMQAHIIAKY